MTINTLYRHDENPNRLRISLLRITSRGELPIVCKDTDDIEDVYNIILNSYIPIESKRSLTIICRVENRVKKVSELMLSTNVNEDSKKNFMLQPDDPSIKKWIDSNFGFEDWELF